MGEAETFPLFQELLDLYHTVPSEARLDHKLYFGGIPAGTKDPEMDITTEWPTFAEFKLGTDIASKPMAGDKSDTSPGYYRGNRLLPKSFLVDTPSEAVQFFKQLENRTCPLGIFYPLGGKIA